MFFFFFAFSQSKKHLSQNFVGRKWNWEFVIWVGNPMRKYPVEMSFLFLFFYKSDKNFNHDTWKVLRPIREATKFDQYLMSCVVSLAFK